MSGKRRIGNRKEKSTKSDETVSYVSDLSNSPNGDEKSKYIANPKDSEIVYGIYFNRSRRFNLRFVAMSIAYSGSSIMHFILNRFQKKISIGKEFLFLVNSNEIMVNELKERISCAELMKQNVLDKRSFFTRIRQDGDGSHNQKIHYNNIISSPFFRICPDENSFYRAVALNFIRNYGNLLDSNKRIRKIVFYDEYSLPSWTLSAAARKKKVKTFAIQHANIPSTHKEYIEFIRTGIDFMPDNIITYCEEEKENLERMIGKKKSPSKISAEGCSRFDSLKDRYDISELRKKFNLPVKGRKIVLWMTQTHVLNDDENDLNCKNMFSLFDRLRKSGNDFELVIKLHPGEIQDNNIYDKYNRIYGNVAKIFRGKENSYDLIRASDAVIIKDSSTFMMVSLIGKEIGILNLIESRPYYKEYGFPVIMRDGKALEKFILGIGSPEHKRISDRFNARISKRYFKNFGHATDKIVGYIRKH